MSKMKNKTFFFLFLLQFASISLFAKERKAVVVIIDGVPNDVVERLQLPVIQEITKKGAYGMSYVGGEVGSYTQTPTISAVGYNTMLTGTWVNKHNVYGNDNMKPNYHYWSFFRIAKEQPFPVTTGIYSSWTDNRTILLGEGCQENNNMPVDYIFDECESDTARFPHREYDLQIFDYDEAVSQAAAESIQKDAPTLSWVYLWYTDDAAHIFGNGNFLDEYVVRAGKQIDRVWQAVKYRQEHFDEDWMIIVTTDHGRTKDGHGHGGQSWRERHTWIATNQKVNDRFKKGECAMVDINPTVCDFLGLQVPDKVRLEQDGLTFFSKNDIKDMKLEKYDEEVTIRWTAVNKSAPVTVYAALDNKYATTGEEQWIKLTELPASKQEYKVSLRELGKSEFYKFALLTPHSSQNRWLKN